MVIDDVAEMGDVEVAAVHSNGNDLYIPLVKYGFGNSVCFEMQMDDPINAGNLLSVSSGWFGSNKYFSQATPYTDDEGWLDQLTINFYALTDSAKTYGIGNYPIVTPEITISIPIFEQDFTLTLLNKLGSIDDLKYYKKPNEIFALNYEWCFLTQNYDGFFIGSKFINENAATMPKQMQYKRFYLVYATDNFKYSVLDIKGHLGTKVNVILEAKIENNKVVLPIILFSGQRNAKNWAIVDENNDIYFASNTETVFTNDEATTKVITFTTRRDRL
jgi:hypothetical protein